MLESASSHCMDSTTRLEQRKWSVYFSQSLIIHFHDISFFFTGCLQMLSGGHRLGITCNHNCCAGGTWYVEVAEDEMASKLKIPVNEKSVITCEVPFGSVIFFNNLIPHRSLENFSQNIRWSLDLRWYFVGISLFLFLDFYLGKNPINRMDFTV